MPSVIYIQPCSVLFTFNQSVTEFYIQTECYLHSTRVLFIFNQCVINIQPECSLYSIMQCVVYIQKCVKLFVLNQCVIYIQQEHYFYLTSE